MPNVGISDLTSSRTLLTAYGSAAGSPGPLLRKIPSGSIASSSRAGAAAGSQHTRQRTRIDVRDGDDVVADEIVAQRGVSPPVACNGRRLAHDEAGHVRRLRLRIA